MRLVLRLSIVLGLIALVSIVVVIAPLPARAQSGASSLLAPETLHRAGLERLWFTQLSLDRSRGRVAGVFQYVSPTESHTVFEVKQNNRRYVFSQRDRDAFGNEIGTDRAKEHAEQKTAELVAEAQAAGATNAAPPAVTAHVVPQITLYFSSERGLVQAINGETGKTLWITQVGNPLYPTTAPAANGEFVGVCNGSTLYVLSAADGSVKFSRSTAGMPGAGPALSHEYIFVPMISGQIESLRLDAPKTPAGIYKSFGRIMTQPVVSDNSVAWSTDSGNLYVGIANGAGIRFRVQASDAASAAPGLLAPDKVLIASHDGYVYCVHEAKGNILWRFTTGESITHPPVTLGETVYVISARGNLFAIDAATASEKWVARGIQSYIAASDQQLYCLDTRGGLAILDQQSGSRLSTVVGVASDLPMMNLQTDRLVLVSGTGMVQCLREADRPFPLVHYLLQPPAKSTRPTPRATAPKTEAAPQQPQASDPFDAAPARPAAAPPPPAGDDPFAAPPAAAAPRAAPPAGSDPFATP